MRVRFVFQITCTVSLFLTSTAQIAKASPINNACELPQDLARTIATKYPGTHIVELSDLNEDDKTLFLKDHANSCPGLTKVDFYGDGKPTFALVLISKDDKTRLVVAHQRERAWSLTAIDTGGGPGPAPVVWSLKAGEYTGVYKGKIQATNPVIVFCGYESWAILYAWTNNKIAKIWLMD